MKGFPNQVADLAKLAKGVQSLAALVDGRRDASDDWVFGEALVRSGVAGTGHSPRLVDEYLAEQRLKRSQNQSVRATARGVWELYRSLGFIDDSASPVVITPLGRQAAAFADVPLDAVQIAYWRRAIRNMQHDGGDGESSHPYQVLLRLIARKPGIAKPLCALNTQTERFSRGQQAVADLPA